MVPRPRREKARRSVLDAMRAAVSTGAYESVTIEGLAEAAEVSKQTIYRWWPSKAAILSLSGSGTSTPQDTTAPSVAITAPAR